MAGQLDAQLFTALAQPAGPLCDIVPSRGSILEIGTYCGYSAIRMAMACPGVPIISLEADPGHVIMARNMLAFAGLPHIVDELDVWTGQSRDLLQRLHWRYKGKDKIQFRVVFMDHKGSRFGGDLQVLENQGLLMPGAIVVADNVLKPGLVKSGAYDTEIVQLKEFAMSSEDWMSISVRSRSSSW